MKTVDFKHYLLCCVIFFLHFSFLTLPQSLRLYFLGEEAMEQEEEDPLAVGNSCGCSRWHRTHCWHRYPCHDYWHSCICGEEGTSMRPTYLKSFRLPVIDFY